VAFFTIVDPMMSTGLPPSGLGHALRHQTDKQAWVNWLFSRVAERYDLGNTLMSAGWHTKWKERLIDLADIRPEHRVLDLACGTGDVTWRAAQRAHRGEVIGTDINPDMMRLAEPKRPLGVDNVTFVQADAAMLPFEDASFDRVTCVYAGRGFPHWPTVIHEVHRVLKPGGHFWNLDFARPPNRAWDTVYRGWMMVSGAALGTALHGHPLTYMYIPASMKAYAGQRWLDTQLEAAGFETHLYETTACLMAYNHGIKCP